QRPHLLDGVVGLMLERALCPLADDEMGFDVGVLERLQHANVEDGAGRAGHADDETPHSASSATAGRTSQVSQQTHENRLRASVSLATRHASREGLRGKVKPPGRIKSRTGG